MKNITEDNQREREPFCCSAIQACGKNSVIKSHLAEYRYSLGQQGGGGTGGGGRRVESLQRSYSLLRGPVWKIWPDLSVLYRSKINVLSISAATKGYFHSTIK